MQRLHFLAPALVLLGSGFVSADEQPQAEILTTKTGVRYGVWPKKPSEPAPTLFIFAGAVEDSLNNEYFRQCGNQLAAQGYLCVSVDLPGHGKEVREGEPQGIDAWRFRIEKQEDPIAEATGRFRKVLDELIETKLTDPEKVAACGTSRGGFMAVHFAAADPRVKAAAAFAPVSNLLALREFAKVSDPSPAEKLSLKHLDEKLAGRAIWLIIGDRDDRVSTDDSITFCRAVTAASLRMNKPALVDCHVVSEPQGHTTPKGAADMAAPWIARQLGTAK